MSLPDRLRPAGRESNAPSGDQRSLIDRRRSVRDAWRWLTELLADYHWWVLAAGAVVAFVLGCIGWHKFLPQPQVYPGRVVHFSDVAYWSFKDFLMNSPGQPGLPWELDVARYLAPVVAGWATLSALGLLFRDRVQQMRIPLLRRHVVICGLGRYAGMAFIRSLREKRDKVVVIELKADNENLELCRSMGVPVIIGDAQRQKTLQAAGARHARRVVAVTDDDAVNTQIVATWRELRKRRLGQLGCLARIAENEYCVLLRSQELQRGDAELSVDFFNIDEIGARLLLEEHRIDMDGPRPHILVAHLDALGQWVVYHAARAWYKRRDDASELLLVTVLDHKPEERIEELCLQHPELHGVCEFKPFRLTADNIGEHLPAHHLSTDTPRIGCVYVTAYHDHEAFETALKLHNALHFVDPALPVVVALSRRHGVVGLVDDVTDAGGLVNVEVFPTMEKACTIDLVEYGSFGPMVRAIHEYWRADQRKHNNPDPSWEELDEARRKSSLAQARDIPVKLRRVGRSIAPLGNWTAPGARFSPEEIDELGKAEHDRWVAERRAAKWKYVDLVDDGTPQAKAAIEAAKLRKETPYLLDWDDPRLPEHVKDWDMSFMRAMPEILAAAGLQMVDTKAALAPKATKVARVATISSGGPESPAASAPPGPQDRELIRDEPGRTSA
jgi:hypothetical protein